MITPEQYKQSRQIAAQKVSEARRITREQRIKQFLCDYGEQFISDFPTMFLRDMLNKYKISEPFYYAIAEYCKLEKDKVALEQQRAQRYIQAMKNGGQEKIRQTCLAKYGVTSNIARPEVHEKAVKASCSTAAREKHKQALQEHYGVSCACALAEGPKTISNINIEFAKELESYGLVVEKEKWVDGVSYDLALGEYLVEINPTVSHSYLASFGAITNRFKDKVIPKDYHYKKWLRAKQSGYELLSLFDWTSRQKLIDFILSKCGVGQQIIGARKLRVQEVKPKEAAPFLEDNHVLGSCKGATLCLALVDKEDILVVMTFGPPRWDKTYNWELLRFATKKGYIISGGASKLFSYFVKNNNGSVITYSDNNLGNGSVYATLGFVQLAQTSPQVIWCNINNRKYISNLSALKYQGVDRILAPQVGDRYFKLGLDREDFIARGGQQEYAKEFELHKDDLTWWPGNQDALIHYKYYPVADCGSTKWAYIPKN